MPKIALTDLRSTILQAVDSAAADFEKWTRNFWVTDYGAEGLIQTRIAERLYSLQENGANQKFAVGIEISISEAANRTLQRADNQKLETAAISGRSRPDICIWDQSGRVPYIVEVKRKWDTETAAQDIRRCGDFVRIFGGNHRIGAKAAFFAVVLHRGLRAGAEYFEPDDKEVQASLVDKARNALARQGHQPLKVSAFVSEARNFNFRPTWPADPASAMNHHQWLWRGAVIEVRRN